MGAGWEIWVDTGGTFTDALGRSPDGRLHRAKVLTTGALRGVALRSLSATEIEIEESWGIDPALVRGLVLRPLAGGDGVEVSAYEPDARRLELRGPCSLGRRAAFEILCPEPAALFAARLLTGVPWPEPLPPARMRLATTLGTNALLERSGAAVALFVTRGFRDLLSIGTQERPELFALAVQKGEPLPVAVVEVPERLDAAGRVIERLSLEPLAAEVARALAAGARVASVALMHAYRNPEHERALAGWLRERGLAHVSCSSDLAPRIKLLPRAETATVDAHLSPLLRTHLDRVEEALSPGGLLVMTSAGGLVESEAFRPADGLLSGPAGGVAGAAVAARRSGISRILGFDMGGTSTDVSRWDGRRDLVYEHRVGAAHVAAPAVAIETVAAGGGSVCRLESGRLVVGPKSAGATPGPACYGAGGPLTLTDVNLLLGRLDARHFGIPIDIDPGLVRLDELREEVEQHTREPVAPEELLTGLLDIANETMADAMRRVSVRRGYDPAEHTLVAFGGAGGQHACAIAERLGVPRILVPADAALLSAVGLGAAVVERFAERQVLEPLSRVEETLPALFDDLAERAGAALRDAGSVRSIVRRRILHLRYTGQEATLEVDWTPSISASKAFHERYEELYGHRGEERPIEVESARVLVTGPEAGIEPAPPPRETHEAQPSSDRRVWLDGDWRDIAVHEREMLAAGASFSGPALVFERRSATFVEPGWRAHVDGALALVLERTPPAAERAEPAEAPPERAARAPAAVRLELSTQRFATLVGEMGERLERTAVSTNVKERRDFSCALLDPSGELVANAPHIPVHLGALGLCVRRVAETLELEPGDVAVTNHPAWGGSHLPDVTVITPVFHGGHLLGYTASRAHHAEIGGARPGSMPPAARRLVQEGVVIPPMHLVRTGTPRWDEIRERLTKATWPSRAVADNLADLRAAIAANHAGAEALSALADSRGADTVLRDMQDLKDLAAWCVGDALERVGDGVYEATEKLDDGTPLSVRIDVEAGRARFDFAGTGPVHRGNLNATPAIVRSAVIYVLRLLVREPLPLNEGLLHPVTLEIPQGLLNPPFPTDPGEAPAVGGGNVETSQRLVDTLLRALGLAACSQGTMNNIIFGGEGYGYYETLGGGEGASPGHHGASGVHTHMTNTRITDPEVLESRYPVRVERFALRQGSGGRGRWHGGEGLVRELRFLRPATVSFLSQHRVEAPYGMRGGGPGLVGRQVLVRKSGEVVKLGPVDGCEAGEGDRLVVETPGGGGWGR